MDGRMRKYSSGPERSRVRNETSTPPPPPPPPSLQHMQQRHHHHHHHHHQQQQQQQQELQQGMRVPVVYYLCRNQHLEHPHFIEVPLSSSDGLYLRDFIARLNVLRGKGMVALYSWSCKRSYKNGFVWHDLSEDDLVLPAHGNEYVLKGSELLDASPSDRPHQSTSRNLRSQKPKQNHNQHEPRLIPPRSEDSSPSSSGTVIREEETPHPPPPQSTLRPPPPVASPQEEELSPTMHGHSSSSGNASPESKRNSSLGSGGSPCLPDYKVRNPSGTADASTQTDEKKEGERRAPVGETCVRGVSTDEGLLGHEPEDEPQNYSSRLKECSEISSGDISPPLTSSSTSYLGRKTDTLESLIRADAQKMNSFRIFGEEEVLAPMGAKLKATNVLMQLITCGSISVKNHHNFGLVHSYKPRLSHMNFPSPVFGGHSMALGELNCLSNSARFMGLRLEEKEYFSGSLVETKKQKEDNGTVVPSLKRSSSFNADRNYKSPDPNTGKKEVVDSGHSNCLPRTIKLSSCKQSKSEPTRSPLSDGPRMSSDSPVFASRNAPKGSSSRRFTDACSSKGSSMRLESFREDKEKIIKIEES